MARIPVHAPSIGEAEARAVADCVRRGELSGNSPVVGRFEQAFAGACGARHAVAVSSGTTALHLAMRAAGIGPGDEVILPTMTFAPCADMVALCGATPVFADSDPGTFNLDPEAVRTLITPRTRAVLAVHLYGHPCDTSALGALCDRHGVTLLEDCAQAIGARTGGRHVGLRGAAGCFSLYANKHITTGEGGMVITDDDALAGRLRHLRSHAMTRGGPGYMHDEVAFNYRLGALQCALGLAQLERLPAMLARRAAVAGRYADALADLPGVRAQAVRAHCERHSYWSHVIVPGDGARMDAEALATALRERGVDTRPFYSPLHRHPPYAGGGHAPMPVAEDLAGRGLVLPSGNALTDDEVGRVCGALSEVLA